MRLLSLLLVVAICSTLVSGWRRRRRLQPRQSAISSTDVAASQNCDERAFRETMISAHNAVRATRALDVLPKEPLPLMRWSNDLAADAQTFVDACPVGHARYTQGGRQSYISLLIGNSESIFYTSNAQSLDCPNALAQQAVNWWAKEKERWDMRRVNPDLSNTEQALGCSPTSKIKTCFHYINMVNYENFEFGCAYNRNCKACSSTDSNCKISSQCPSMEIEEDISPARLDSAIELFLANVYPKCSAKHARVRGNYGASTVVCRYRTRTMPIRGFGGKYSVVLPYLPSSPIQTAADKAARRPPGRQVGVPWFHENRYIDDQYIPITTQYALFVRGNSNGDNVWLPILQGQPICTAIDDFVATYPHFESQRSSLLRRICTANDAKMDAGDQNRQCPSFGSC